MQVKNKKNKNNSSASAKFDIRLDQRLSELRHFAHSLRTVMIGAISVMEALFCKVTAAISLAVGPILIEGANIADCPTA